MKTLTLLRHAKSTWDDPVARDFDRPLNKRGRRAAVAIGREMRALDLAFDRVVASPAVRVKETLDGVAEGYGRRLDAAFEPRIYLATCATLLDLVYEAPARAETMLLVGHNPGLEALALALAADGPLRAEIAVKYPTATLVALDFAVTHWRDIAEGGGEIARLIRPRDLDPELGPDEDS